MTLLVEIHLLVTVTRKVSITNDYINETVLPNVFVYPVSIVETSTVTPDTVMLHVGTNNAGKDRFKEMAENCFFNISI